MGSEITPPRTTLIGFVGTNYALNKRWANYENMKNTITKAQFVVNYCESIEQFLSVQFVTHEGRRIGYLHNGQICPMPKTKKDIGAVYAFFQPRAEMIAYPQFSKGGRYLRHDGEPITVVSKCTIGKVNEREFLSVRTIGYTQTGRESKSYVVGKFAPCNCEDVDLYSLKIQK